jgi:hypothetical protein
MWAKSIAIGKGVGFASVFLGFRGFVRFLGQFVENCFYHALRLKPVVGFLWVTRGQMYFHLGPFC